MSVAYKIELPEEVAAQLEASAKEQKIAATAIMSRAVLDYLEDQKDLKEAITRTSDPNRKLYTSEEAKKYLGI